MIKVTRFNGTELLLNPDQIMTVESTPDTVIRLSNGEMLMVKDKPEQISQQFLAYKRAIMNPQPL